ncbi:amidohydrolase family protein [Deferrisoma sp.]
MNPSDRRVFSASWVLTMDGPALEGGAVFVEGGTIRQIGKHEDVAQEAGAAERVDLPGFVLLPPLVNAHAHLELTGLRPPVAPGFAEWVLGVIAEKRAAPPARWARAAAAGAEACLGAGQGWVADVVTRSETAQGYPVGGPRILAFPELIAAHDEHLPAAWAGLERLETACGGRAWGVSPHAPYTVCAEGFRRVAGRARLMVHLAETAAEVEFCREGTGPIRDTLYETLGLAPPPAPGLHPVDWLDRLGILRPGAIVVHAVHVERRHVEVLARSGTGVVLCPRSNRRLSGRAAPGRAFLDAGVPVALGTDSVLSSGDLDLRADAAAAVDDYGWSPEEAVRVATRGGAEVLGLGAGVGRFSPGARADMMAVPLEGRDPWETVLGGGRVEALWLDGEAV